MTFAVWTKLDGWSSAPGAALDSCGSELRSPDSAFVLPVALVPGPVSTFTRQKL